MFILYLLFLFIFILVVNYLCFICLFSFFKSFVILPPDWLPKIKLYKSPCFCFFSLCVEEDEQLVFVACSLLTRGVKLVGFVGLNKLIDINPYHIKNNTIIPMKPDVAPSVANAELITKRQILVITDTL